MTGSQLTKPRFWLRAGLGLVCGIGFAIAFQHHPFKALLQNCLPWVKQLGPTGVFAFIGIYNLATLLLVPACLLAIGGGALYGLVWGSIYVIVASVVGAIVTFGLGRYWARDWVYRQVQAHPKFQAIDQAIAHAGLKIALLTRLSPIFPFNLLNYIFGVTCISFRDYAIGLTGMLPGIVVYVYIGSITEDLLSLGTPQEISPQIQIMQWLLKGTGLLATIGVTVYITRIARRALNQTVVTHRADL